ncbi:MAG: mannose-1-phosphate guanylyltransferase, partial [Bacteroidetes bacterium]|nr:mannose-1-phosphate guanylyltransferase [Bacteroidota bacterium]
MDKNNIYVAIMAGGIGSRFWPMSRVERPKQFLDILGTGRSLLQLTYDRFIEIAPKKNIFVVTNEAYRELTKEQLPGLSDEQIMGEPFRRNTAPCVAWVSNKIANLNPNANMIVSPADHLILKEDAFKEKMIQGLEFVNSKDCLITLGIKPTRPDTGYGYIQYLEEKEEHGVYKVKTFTEKPTLEIAKSFLESGDFLWNSGMFIWSTRSIIKAFKKYLPEIGEVFEDGKKIYNTEKEKEFISKAYE